VPSTIAPDQIVAERKPGFFVKVKDGEKDGFRSANR